MQTLAHTQVWNHFLTFIQDRCSSSEFQNWIAPIEVLSEDRDELTLVVPNVFVQEYLLANYHKDLKTFVPLRGNGELALQFVIAEEKKASSPHASFIVQPQEEAPSTLKLNPLYRFESFIEGSSNQFAKSAALGVAMRPGKSYNPLFIYGGVGLGKTHLLHAIGHYAKEHHKKLKIQSITTEGFINEIIENLKAKSMDRLKRQYRSLDILLVDDIQFLQGRLNFEEEICNTFEALINENKQIVITSDKPPSQLKLSERLVARMEWGLVAHISVPDLETRVAILQHKADERGLKMPHKVALFIANHVYNNVRQLEGAVNRLTAYSRLIGKEVTEEVASTTLGELLQTASTKRISVESILKSVASLFHVRVGDLKGASRAKQVAFPRQVAMYLAKELIHDSLNKLASSFGGKTHSTLIHAWKKIHDQVEKDETLRQQIQTVKRDLET